MSRDREAARTITKVMKGAKSKFTFVPSIQRSLQLANGKPCESGNICGDTTFASIDHTKEKLLVDCSCVVSATPLSS